MEALGINDTPQIEVELAAGEDKESRSFLARGIEGDATLQWTATGDGEFKAEVLTSNDGVNFNDICDDICTGQGATSGIGGTNMAPFIIPPCDEIRIKFTETSASDGIAIVARLRAR